MPTTCQCPEERGTCPTRSRRQSHARRTKSIHPSIPPFGNLSKPLPNDRWSTPRTFGRLACKAKHHSSAEGGMTVGRQEQRSWILTEVGSFPIGIVPAANVNGALRRNPLEFSATTRNKPRCHAWILPMHWRSPWDVGKILHSLPVSSATNVVCLARESQQCSSHLDYNH